MNTQVSGVNIHAVGWILLIIGSVGTTLSMIFWSSWVAPGYRSRRRTTNVEDSRPPYYVLGTPKPASADVSEPSAAAFRGYKP